MIVAVGHNYIIVSQDYGVTWKYASCAGMDFSASNFNDVEILDAAHFVILGNSGATDFVYRASIL
jgi:hypothetical protein